uniref:Choline/carnitine acyltransferase domain-containing protein n=1 Tax=Cryptomonas curvata TaxID=233186 RepID=A0A7S0MIS1_9CRYP
MGDVDGALLVVCLDADAPPSWNHRSQEVLHASAKTVGNRWFDKHQVIACGAGSVSLLFEHSFGDGAAWNRWLEAATADMKGEISLPRLPEVSSLGAGSGPKALPFEVPPALEPALATARREAEEMTRTCRTAILQYGGYGKQRIKQWKLSPDGLVQMAMQYAYARLHGRIAPTYESCAMLSFFHGRTEVIRSAHAPGAAMVAALLSSQEAVRPGYTPRSKGDKQAAIRAAVAHQGSVSKLSGQGLGVDRHFLALSKMAQREGVAPAMFGDEEFGYSKTWRLSTSNVSTPWNACFNFGPVTDHCYGIGYLIHEEGLVLNTTTWAASSEADAAAMRTSLQASLDELAAIFDP